MKMRNPLAALCLLLSFCAAARAADWQSLTPGGSLAGWKVYGKPAETPITWKIEGEVLAWQKGTGSILTKETYSDFELELEWKISPGGNSGVMFGVDESGKLPWHTGPELQILDDSVHRDGKSPLTSAGALYSLYAPLAKAAKPAGEWNKQRVRVQAGHVQSWLNGTLVVDAQIGTDDWNTRVAKSKFAPFPKFAKVSPGSILLQDHGDPVWFRAMRIRRL